MLQTTSTRKCRVPGSRQTGVLERFRPIRYDIGDLPLPAAADASVPIVLILENRLNGPVPVELKTASAVEIRDLSQTQVRRFRTTVQTIPSYKAPSAAPNQQFLVTAAPRRGQCENQALSVDLSR